MYASSYFEQDDGANLRFFFITAKKKKIFFLCVIRKKGCVKIAHALCRVQITYLKLQNFA